MAASTSYTVSGPISDEQRISTITVPAGALCELRKTANKGLGMFATSDIPAGCVIMSESPLLFIEKQLDDIEEDDVVTAVASSDEDKQKQFFRLRDYDNGNRAFHGANRYRNAFAAYNFTVRAVGDPGSETVAGGATSMLPGFSSINHSCSPNAEFDQEVLPSLGLYELFAVRSIAKDEEITMSYNPAYYYMSHAERSTVDPGPMVAICRCDHCEACRRDPTRKKLSDERRAKLRTLYRNLYHRDIVQNGRNGSEPSEFAVFHDRERKHSYIESAKLLQEERISGLYVADQIWMASMECQQRRQNLQRLEELEQLTLEALAVPWRPHHHSMASRLQQQLIKTRKRLSEARLQLIRPRMQVCMRELRTKVVKCFD
ncbi:hypothetical protein MBLNU459_g6189t1 [Dothideomycetes sp. NU459]